MGLLQELQAHVLHLSSVADAAMLTTQNQGTKSGVCASHVGAWQRNLMWAAGGLSRPQPLEIFSSAAAAWVVPARWHPDMWRHTMTCAKHAPPICSQANGKLRWTGH